MVPETSNAYTDLTAWQNLMLMGELYGLLRDRASKRATDLLGMLGLLERKDQKVQAYSKGMKQRLILAMALLHEPGLLFLDEPTSGLDVQSTQMILSLLRDLNRSGPPSSSPPITWRKQTGSVTGWALSGAGRLSPLMHRKN